MVSLSNQDARTSLSSGRPLAGPGDPGVTARGYGGEDFHAPMAGWREGRSPNPLKSHAQ
jgi:hypothetical protein